MAIDDLLHRADHLLERRLPGKREQRMQHIRITPGRGQVVIKNAFLQWRQRVDVLHVGGATRYPGDDTVDGRLGQLHQRQHGRSDVFGVQWYRVGGYAE